MMSSGKSNVFSQLFSTVYENIRERSANGLKKKILDLLNESLYDNKKIIRDRITPQQVEIHSYNAYSFYDVPFDVDAINAKLGKKTLQFSQLDFSGVHFTIDAVNNPTLPSVQIELENVVLRAHADLPKVVQRTLNSLYGPPSDAAAAADSTSSSSSNSNTNAVSTSSGPSASPSTNGKADRNTSNNSTTSSSTTSTSNSGKAHLASEFVVQYPDLLAAVERRKHWSRMKLHLKILTVILIGLIILFSDSAVMGLVHILRLLVTVIVGVLTVGIGSYKCYQYYQTKQQQQQQQQQYVSKRRHKRRGVHNFKNQTLDDSQNELTEDELMDDDSYDVSRQHNDNQQPHTGHSATGAPVYTHEEWLQYYSALLQQQQQQQQQQMASDAEITPANGEAAVTSPDIAPMTPTQMPMTDGGSEISSPVNSELDNVTSTSDAQQTTTGSPKLPPQQISSPPLLSSSSGKAMTAVVTPRSESSVRIQPLTPSSTKPTTPATSTSTSTTPTLRPLLNMPTAAVPNKIPVSSLQLPLSSQMSTLILQQQQQLQLQQQQQQPSIDWLQYLYVVSTHRTVTAFDIAVRNTPRVAWSTTLSLAKGSGVAIPSMYCDSSSASLYVVASAFVYCIDCQKGLIKWVHQYDELLKQTRISLAVSKFIYICFNGKLLCLNKQTGALLWGPFQLDSASGRMNIQIFPCTQQNTDATASGASAGNPSLLNSINNNSNSGSNATSGGIACSSTAEVLYVGTMGRIHIVRCDAFKCTVQAKSELKGVFSKPVSHVMYSNQKQFKKLLVGTNGYILSMDGHNLDFDKDRDFSNVPFSMPVSLLLSPLIRPTATRSLHNMRRHTRTHSNDLSSLSLNSLNTNETEASAGSNISCGNEAIVNNRVTGYVLYVANGNTLRAYDPDSIEKTTKCLWELTLSENSVKCGHCLIDYGDCLLFGSNGKIAVVDKQLQTVDYILLQGANNQSPVTLLSPKSHRVGSSKQRTAGGGGNIVYAGCYGNFYVVDLDNKASRQIPLQTANQLIDANAANATTTAANATTTAITATATTASDEDVAIAATATASTVSTTTTTSSSSSSSDDDPNFVLMCDAFTNFSYNNCKLEQDLKLMKYFYK